MGKIRIKAFDETSAEDEAKLIAKREAKKAEKMAAKNELRALQGKKINPQTEAVVKSIKSPVVKETEVEVETTQVEALAPSHSEQSEESIEETAPAVEGSDVEQKTKLASAKSSGEAKKTKKEKFVKVKELGKRHKENLGVISKNQIYPIDQALEALKKFKKSKFDETVELHINTKEKGVSGQVILPHGTGKTMVIKIADEEILAEVAKGKINFDVLVATPSMMPSLARVAKVLGPKGLMPNPKNGTVSEKPEEAVKKLSGGQISYKTESVSPIIHVSVGKLSFEDKKLKENIKAFISSVGAPKISSVTLKSTMSPGIKISV